MNGRTAHPVLWDLYGSAVSVRSSHEALRTDHASTGHCASMDAHSAPKMQRLREISADEGAIHGREVIWFCKSTCLKPLCLLLLRCADAESGPDHLGAYRHIHTNCLKALMRYLMRSNRRTTLNPRNRLPLATERTMSFSTRTGPNRILRRQRGSGASADSLEVVRG